MTCGRAGLPGLRHPGADRAPVRAAGDRAHAGSCGREPRVPAVPGLGAGLDLPQDLDQTGELS